MTSLTPEQKEQASEAIAKAMTPWKPSFWFTTWFDSIQSALSKVGLQIVATLPDLYPNTDARTQLERDFDERYRFPNVDSELIKLIRILKLERDCWIQNFKATEADRQRLLKQTAKEEK